MTENSPRDSLTVEWRSFRAGARGCFAITALLLIVFLIVAAYGFGFWRVTSAVSSYVANAQASVARGQ